MEPTDLITRKEAAEILGLKQQTMALWAMHGVGPRVYKQGNHYVRYSEADVRQWVGKRPPVKAAKEATKARRARRVSLNCDGSVEHGYHPIGCGTVLQGPAERCTDLLAEMDKHHTISQAEYEATLRRLERVEEIVLRKSGQQWIAA